MEERLGLTRERARELLVQHGLNEIGDGEGVAGWRILVGQFESLLVWLLLAAGGVAWWLGERVDAGFILAIVVLNTGFGFYQEYKAERVLSALKKMTVVRVRVVRDGAEEEIDSREVVPGEVVYVEPGTRVPADGVMLDGKAVEVDEAALTGESMPVAKSELFMGTIVATGRGFMEVMKTGRETRFGKIAGELLGVREVKTPWQKKMEVFSRQVGLVGMLAAGLVFGVSKSFLFAVSLAVAAVPEGLPAVITVTLAVGVERMAKKKAVVRRLAAIESLGGVSVVLTDKTGTLTENKMEVKQMWEATDGAGGTMQLAGVLCSTAADGGIGDPTEVALLAWAGGVGEKRKEWRLVSEVPFDSGTKKMSVTVERDGEKLELTKGAPEAVMAGCRMTGEMRREIKMGIEKMAGGGLRLIGFARGKRFLGLVGLADPVRPEVAEAVRKAREAGIKVVMVTGDNELTAKSVGLETGIVSQEDEVVSGKELERLGDEELEKLLEKVKIFARTTPEDKLRLVRLWQKKGETVAVTGDGVNDALALKQAEVGVAMGKVGTDVAREAADMVITDDNFATIVVAIEEGRNIFARMRGAAKFLLACNLGEVGYILTAVFLAWPVLSPLQILYVNLVTDGLPALAFAFIPSGPGLMRGRRAGLGELLGKKEWGFLLRAGGVTAAAGLVLAAPFFGWSEVARVTLAFCGIILVQPLVLLSLWRGRWVQPVLLAAILLPVILQIGVLYWRPAGEVIGAIPLGVNQLGYLAIVGLVASWVMLGKSWGKN